MVIAAISTIFLISMSLLVWRRRTTGISVLAHERHMTTMFAAFSWWRFYAKNISLVLAVAALGIALFRPRQVQEGAAQRERRRDLMLLVDVSRSMLAADCAPNRLRHAREKISNLMNALPVERAGLMVFAGAPCLLCPLTEDHQTVRTFLDDIDEHMISESSTSYHAALSLLLERFKDQSGGTRLAVLVTDGEDFSQVPPELYQQLKEAGIFVATLGIGTAQGAPIQDPTTRELVKDRSGAVVITRRDNKMLEALASSCGGIYVPSDTQGTKDIDTMVAWIKHFEAQEQTVAGKQHYEEYYTYPTALSLLFFFLAWCL